MTNLCLQFYNPRKLAYSTIVATDMQRHDPSAKGGVASIAMLMQLANEAYRLWILVAKY